MLSDNTRGALVMMASMAAFTFNDLCVKAIGDALPLSQLLALRGVLTCSLIFLLARYLGALNWRMSRRDWGLVLLRSVAEIAAAYTFLTALLHMPFANVTALLQTLPLSLTLAAALFFGESVGWRRVLAIIVGFLGVLLIVKPGTEGFNIYALYVIGAVISVTVRDLAARRLSKDVPTLTATLVAAGMVTLFAGMASLGGEWVALTVRTSGLLVLTSLFVMGGYVFSVMVMRIGEVSFTAPFRYTALLWALILGFVFFGEWPDNWTLLGCAIIVAAGVFTLLREAALRRKQT